MGSKVKLAFISAFNDLKYAKLKLNALERNPHVNPMEHKAAENNFHRAESIFCAQEGIVEDTSSNALTKDQAANQVNSMMNEMRSWYA